MTAAQLTVDTTATTATTTPFWRFVRRYVIQPQSVRATPLRQPQQPLSSTNGDDGIFKIIVKDDSTWCWQLSDRLYRQRPVWFAIGFPFVLVTTAWLILMSVRHTWHMYLSDYEMPVAMVFGALVAGSTPCGGNFVAFPVLTLLLGHSAQSSRDFALVIQSIGMNAAGFAIVYQRVLIDGRVIALATIGGVVGVVIGLVYVSPNIGSLYAKLFFVSYFLAFVCVRAATTWLRWRRTRHCDDYDTKPADAAAADASAMAMLIRVEQLYERSNAWIMVALVAAGVLGGVLSATLGSGMDIFMYSVLTLVFNVSERVAVPTAVICMGLCSVYGSFVQGAILGRLDPEATDLAWLCLPIVVIMAPLGSYVASHLRPGVLGGFVYVLTVVQFVSALVILRVDAMRALFVLACVLLGISSFSLMYGVGAGAGVITAASKQEQQQQQQQHE